MLLSFGANEDGQCGRHNFESEDEEEGYGNFIDTAGSPSSPISALRRKTSERLMNVGKVPSMVHFRFSVIIRNVAAGSRHSLALSSSGQIYSWGWGVQGQLGHGLNKTIMTPRRVEIPASPTSGEVEPVISISAGGMHSACITSSGECYTWGASQYGQLGLGQEVVEAKTCNEPSLVMLHRGGASGKELPPSDIPFIIESISCGGMHTAAVDKDGILWCWGRADSGQTGQHEWIFNFFPGLVVPHMVPSIEEKVAAVACGGFHTVAVTRCGRVYSMGKEDFGILGTAVRAKQGTVLLIDSLLDETIVGVSCGGWHTVLWNDEGDMFVCGKGEYGRLGLGHEASVCEPQRVPLGEDVKVRSASAGGSHTLILTKDNDVLSTGRTGEGRLAIANVDRDRILNVAKVDYDYDDLDEKRHEICHVSAGGGHSFLLRNSE